MKIMHLIHTPRYSGAEVLVRDLCLMHKEMGHDSMVVAFCPSEVSFDQEIEILRKSAINVLVPQHKLSRVERVSYFGDGFDNYVPDVIVAHSVLPSFYGRLGLLRSFLKGKRRRVKFISVLHAPGDNFGFAGLRLAELFLRPLLDRVISVSDISANIYIEKFGSSIPINIIKNGVVFKKFDINRSMARQKFGISNELKVILQVGRIYPTKRQEQSILAMADILTQSNAELWFAGLVEDKSYAKMIKNIAIQLGVEGKIRWLGSRGDVPQLLATADVFLMPSVVESQGIALIEALYSGVPVVCSDIEAFEFAKEMPGVLVVNPNDVNSYKNSINYFLDNGGRFSRNLSVFDFKNTASEYLDVFGDSASSSNR